MFYLQYFSGKVVAVLLLAATVTMGVWADTSESVDHASQLPTLAPDVEGSSEVTTPEENKGAVLSEEYLYCAYRSWN